MRKIRRGHLLTLLLAGLLTCPAVALAESFACFHKAHHCTPAPASHISRCCISAADTAQASSIAKVIVADGPAATRGSVGDLMPAVPETVCRSRGGPSFSPPIDRLALFGQLLI